MLIHDWRQVLKRAWSTGLIVSAGHSSAKLLFKESQK